MTDSLPFAAMVKKYHMEDAFVPVLNSGRWALWLKQPAMANLEGKLREFTTATALEILAALAYLMRLSSTSRTPVLVPVPIYVPGACNLTPETPMEEHELRAEIITVTAQAAAKHDVRMTQANWTKIATFITEANSWENLISVVCMGRVNML